MKALLIFFLLTLVGHGVTKEVVRVFFPASYHDTDSASEFGVKGDLLQAAVIDRAMVLSGAFPEDLAKSVAAPFRFASNNATYEVAEANLIVLCGLQLKVVREEKGLKVTIDGSQMEIPEVVELSLEQLLTMSIEAIRRTLRVYYRDDAHEPFQCRIELKGFPEKLASLEKLATTFRVGPEEDPG